MDRNTAVTTWREVCGNDTVMASGAVTGRMLEDFARRIEATERERWRDIASMSERLEQTALKLADENDGLRAALLKCARQAEALKRDCGMNPESPQAMRNAQYQSISTTAHIALGTILGPDAQREDKRRRQASA